MHPFMSCSTKFICKCPTSPGVCFPGCACPSICVYVRALNVYMTMNINVYMTVVVNMDLDVNYNDDWNDGT